MVGLPSEHAGSRNLFYQTPPPGSAEGTGALNALSAHFIVLTAGVPYLRTLVWSVGWVAQMAIAWQVLAH